MLGHCIETDSEVHGMCEELEEACWTTALVRYARCFSGRQWLTGVVEAKFSAKQYEDHLYFRFIRDKMIGHAIGGLGEDFEVTAAVFPGSKGRLEVVGVGARPRRVCSLGENMARDFLLLVEHVAQIVDELYARERTHALTALRQQSLSDVVRGQPIGTADLDMTRHGALFRRYFNKALSQRAPNDAREVRFELGQHGHLDGVK